jgi:hypothetical protein
VAAQSSDSTPSRATQPHKSKPTKSRAHPKPSRPKPKKTTKGTVKRPPTHTESTVDDFLTPDSSSSFGAGAESKRTRPGDAARKGVGGTTSVPADIDAPLSGAESPPVTNTGTETTDASANASATSAPDAKPPAEGASEAPPPPSPSPLKLALFADAYGAWQSSGPGTLATRSGHRAFSGQGATLRAENGFSLAFVGFDAAYDSGKVGAVLNLRFGEGAQIYHHHSAAESDFTFGVDHLTQAYALWRPVPQLELDLGMFMTPFGAEVLESWKNENYTRGALFFYAQPAWHTGLKAKWDLASAFSLVFLVADGTNNLSETQQGSGLDQTPNVGLQAIYTPNEELAFSLGGLYAPRSRGSADEGFDEFADFVATLKFGGFSASANADFILTHGGAPDGGDRHFLGASVIPAYHFSPSFGLAVRGEYLRDDANFGDSNRWWLITTTLTADYTPIPDVPNLILRWDNRWERSNQNVFGHDSRGTADLSDDLYTNIWFESVIGVVVTSAP